MAGPAEERIVVVPEHPGDVVCSRYVLRLLADETDTSAVVKRGHVPLLADLPIRCVAVGDFDELEAALPEARFDEAIDLQGDLRTARFVARVARRTIGFDEADIGVTYHDSFPWREAGLGNVHMAVRHARAVPRYRRARVFDIEAWKRAGFAPLECACGHKVALCPGSSLLGADKRLPPVFWQRWRPGCAAMVSG
jgi:ADP-heptose:LPS heptosyltransferase